MMATGLNGRLTRLEAMMRPGTGHCRSCSLRHVQPLTMDLARRIIGPVSSTETWLHRYAAENPAPKLCLCDPCCGDSGDRRFASRSHGITRRLTPRDGYNPNAAAAFPRNSEPSRM
jgi:hypothetical protein